MTHLIEHLTINVDDTNRVAVYQDEAAYDYTDVTGDSVGVFTIAISRGYREVEGGELTGELNSIKRNVHHWQLESAVGKYLTLTNRPFKRVWLQGYDPNEWAEVFIYGDKFEDATSWLDGAADSLKRWWRGDVYMVAHERLITYTAPNGNTKTEWETEAAIGCVTADYRSEIAQIAADFFSIELAFKVIELEQAAA
jgi:hypothetical protein